MLWAATHGVPAVDAVAGRVPPLDVRQCRRAAAQAVRWRAPHAAAPRASATLFGDTRASFGDSRVESSALKTPSLT